MPPPGGSSLTPAPRAVLLPKEDLIAIFEALQVLEKIRSGTLSDDPLSAAPSKAIVGGLSYIIKRRNAAGLHVATTHALHNAAGKRTRHWHGKDILIGRQRFAAASE